MNPEKMQRAATPPPSLLIVDDAPAVRQMLIRILRAEQPFCIEEASDGEEAQAKLAEREFDVVITDLNMPGIGGLELMAWALRHHPGAAWIILSGYGTFETAVQAVQLGAFDFVSKPLESRTGFCVTVRNAVEQKRLQDETKRLNVELIDANQELQQRVGQLEAACRLLGDQSEIITEDLRRAERIQRALLPNAVPQVQGFSAAALYRPSQSIGGDFYDLIRFDEDRVAFVIADAAGHGVSAAMVSVLFKTRLQQLKEEQASQGPAHLLQRLNEFLCEECASPGLFITAAYGIYDAREGRIRFSSAGHPPPILRRRNGDLEMLAPTGPALGLSIEAKYVETQLRFERGDELLFYTDGIYADWSGLEHSVSERLAEMFCEARSEGPESLTSLFAMASRQVEEAPQEDDVTLLWLMAEEGFCHLDNGPSEASPQPARREVPPLESAVLIGSDATETTLSVEGRGVWTHCGSFYERAISEISRGRGITVDLSACAHLDSTFLGTVHEVVTFADEHGAPIRLQGVMGQVLDEFCELGMSRVLQHLSPTLHSMPTPMTPMRSFRREEDESKQRLLKAHEALSGLSDENRAEFQQLIDALRAEACGSSTAC